MKGRLPFANIEELIQNAELKTALEKLHELALKYDQYFEDSVNILLSRQRRLQDKEIKGIINNSEANHERNIITDSTLKLLADLERRKTDISNNKQLKFNSDPKNEMMQAAISAVILVDLEKIRYRYFYAPFHLRGDILDEIRVYKPISTDITTIEFYKFLLEVADSIGYGTPDNYGVKLLNLVGYFFPDDSENVETILDLSFNIGNLLVNTSFFNLENFEIGVYGLSIWKWVYLKAEAYKMEIFKEKIRKEYQSVKMVYDNFNIKVSNYEEKIRLMDIFKEDLEEKGLTFPNIPYDLLEFT